MRWADGVVAIGTTYQRTEATKTAATQAFLQRDCVGGRRQRMDGPTYASCLRILSKDSCWNEPEDGPDVGA